MPTQLELLLHLRVVFDDAVVNDGDVARTVEVRMGVHRLGRPVGRPASVANARIEAARGVLALERQRPYRLCPLSGAGPPGLAGANEGDTGRVVTAIFQSREARKQRLERVAGAYDPDDAAHGTSLLVGFSGPEGSVAVEHGEPLAEHLDELGIERFDHDPNHWLGARRPNEQAHIIAIDSVVTEQLVKERLHREVVEVLARDAQELLGHSPPGGAREVGERSAPHDQLGEQETRQEAVPGRGEVAEDHVTGLLATENPRTLLERQQDVAVTDVRLFDLDAGRSERAVETEVAHRGDGDAAAEHVALVTVEGEEHHEIVAVAYRSLVVDGDQAVGVAVDRETQVGVELAHGVHQAATCVEPASSLMLRPSGRSWMTVTSAPVEAKSSWTTCDAAPFAQSTTMRRLERSAGASSRRCLTYSCSADSSISTTSNSIADRTGGREQRALNGCFGGKVELCAADTEDLQSIVVVRVVRRRHDNAGAMALLGDHGDAGGREVTEVDPMRSAVTQSREDGRRQGGRTLSSVVPHEDSHRQHGCDRASEPVRQLDGNLVARAASNSVRAKSHGHGH